MSEVVYGLCDKCGKKFLTMVEAREALNKSRCPRCGRYLFKQDFNKELLRAMKL